MIDPEDQAVIEHAAHNPGELIEIVVTGCAYSCCGKGWRRKDGYEQTYRGRVDNHQPGPHGTFLLYSMHGGQPAYVVAVRYNEVIDATPVPA